MKPHPKKELMFCLLFFTLFSIFETNYWWHGAFFVNGLSLVIFLLRSHDMRRYHIRRRRNMEWNKPEGIIILIIVNLNAEEEIWGRKSRKTFAEHDKSNSSIDQPSLPWNDLMFLKTTDWFVFLCFDSYEIRVVSLRNCLLFHIMPYSSLTSLRNMYYTENRSMENGSNVMEVNSWISFYWDVESRNFEGQKRNWKRWWCW